MAPNNLPALRGNVPAHLSQDVAGVPHGVPPTEGDGLDIGDILFILLRHKWKIIFLGWLGLACAAALYFLHGALFETHAKLLVRYVLERSAFDSELGSEVQTTGRGEVNVIHDEIEILTSWDLAIEVAESVGIDKLLEGTKEEEKSEIAAAGTIVGNFEALSGRDSNVISVVYRNRDPKLATTVLNELITRYFDKHLEIHRSVGASDFVSKQTQQVRNRLEEIEDELNRLKKEAGSAVYSTGIASTGFGADGQSPGEALMGAPASWAKTRQSLLDAETERAARLARIKALEGIVSRTVNGDQLGVQPTDTQVAEYQVIVDRLSQLRVRDVSLRAKFPPENRLVVRNRTDIQELESKRRALALKYPVLIAMATSDSETNNIDIDAEWAQLAETEARIEVLQAKVEEIGKAEEDLPGLLSRMNDLKRLKAAEEEKYFYFSSAVEKARIDEMLDPSKMPNISVVQSASPPVKVISSMMKKVILLLAGGGFAAGVGIALALELFIDRRIKRSCEIEKRLHMPLMLTIPMLPPGRGSGKYQWMDEREDEGQSSGINGAVRLVESAHEDRLWPYAAAIRDRLFSHFQLNQIDVEGPKLVAITGFAEGSGASTIANSVAAISAASGERVLLVDMNAGWDEPNSIFDAERILRGNFGEAGAENRAIYSEAEGYGSMPGPVTPKNLYDLLPIIRQSDFGYIFFDLPPIGSTSPTNSMAGLMHKVLLVVDATTTNRDVAKAGYEEMLKVGADVSCIYNKAVASTSGDRLDIVAERRRQLTYGLIQRATTATS